MEDRALDHALESGGGGRVRLPLGRERGQLVVEIGADRPADILEIDAARFHHLRGMLIGGERKSAMPQRAMFMPTMSGLGSCAVLGLFQLSGKRRHSVHSG